LLKTLYIKNYALIKDIQLKFGDSFTTITGETGAGKSILLGALSLLLGSRADKDSLRDANEKCIIEAEFDLSKFNLKDIFLKQDLDYEELSIIRREITSNKTRAFINDTPVNLKILNELKPYLIDIHSQNETQSLSKPQYQYQVLDKIASNAEILNLYRQALKAFKKCQQELEDLKTARVEASKKHDYNQFLFEELEQANLYKGVQEDLENEFHSLQNAEDIQYQLSACIDGIQKEDFGIYDKMASVNHHLGNLTQNISSYKDLKDRIQSALIEIEDIGNELESRLDKVEVNPERLEKIEVQYQNLNNLLKKHQVQTDEELIEIKRKLENELVDYTNFDEKIKKTKVHLEEYEVKLSELSGRLTLTRKKSSKVLEQQLVNLLSGLGMENATMKVVVKNADGYNNYGKDDIDFMFSANKGMPLRLLHKVASGGEMSRIMLAIKSTIARYENLPSIIFDEIDTGVSGEIALKMGEIMKDMSNNMQVISITHLPQIASKGIQHLKVMKNVLTDTTETQIKHLSREERIVELSQMLGGSENSASAIAHAKSLLN
jgi:DNA repair protein RecN (Recombination protein N)